MPQFDATTRSKIEDLRAIRNDDAQMLEAYELVEVQWPSPDGTIYYASQQVDETASVAPPVSPIECKLMAEDFPNYFLPHQTGTLIGDEEINLTFWDGNDAISDLIIEHGEGVKVILHYWFPQVELLLPMWQGHLRNEEENSFGLLKLKAAQGFRAADATVPGRAHWQPCQRIFGGLLATQDEIDEHGCNYNLHIGGGVGTTDPDTGLPWTFCDRLNTASCTVRGIDPLRHLSHLTMVQSVINDQTHGGRIYSTSIGNASALTEPVRVVLGQKRIFGMPVMQFRRDLNNNHPDQGFFLAMYEGCEGPVTWFQDTVIHVGQDEQYYNPQHFNFRLGNVVENPVSALSTHGYSNTAHVLYNFGWVDPSSVDPGDCHADSTVRGLNTRIYTDPDTYTVGWNTLPGTHLMAMLCDKRWGYGLDYERLYIQDFIDLDDWADDYIRFTDTFGTNWDYYRATSNMELVGRKIQQQIEDYCRAMHVSQPFLFDGKIHVMPLTKLDTGELADCPVFTDEGTGRNVIFDKQDGVDRSTLKVSRKSDLELINRVECKYDDITQRYVTTPLNPVEDVDAQLRAGRVVGDHSRKTNKKEFNLLGVVVKEQAIKMAWSLLDLGESDTGGLQNNCRITFKIWFADALDLHPYKVIKFDNAKLQAKYGFNYFRILPDGIEKGDDLIYTIKAQAYPDAYYETFETVISPPAVADLGDADEPCVLQFGTVRFVDGQLIVPIAPCDTAGLTFLGSGLTFLGEEVTFAP